MRKALFLDRDGIINEDGHYVHRIEDFHFLPEIFDLCRDAKQKGYLLIVFTNQSGIARGYFSEDDFHTLTDWMCARFAEEGAPIDRVYYCPYHPEKGVGPYKRESEDRKPSPGMLYKARDEFGLDLSQCAVLGDRDRDVDSGRNAGVKNLILMPSEYGHTAAEDVHVISTLTQAKELL